MNPLTSGKNWERIPVQGTHAGVNNGYIVWNADDHNERAYFKYASAHQWSSPYSIGIERTAFTLASALDFPVKPTFLETVEGHPGAITLWIPGTQWFLARDDLLASHRIADRQRWPCYMALDVLLGNIDRHERNIHVEWDPSSVERLPDDEEVCTTWLCDYGFSGLWPPGKFDATLTAADLEALDPDADIAPDSIAKFQADLPSKFRQSWLTADREEVLDLIRGIPEDQIEAAVREVPTSYISTTAADLTVQFLLGRLRRMDTLLLDVLPM